MFLQRSIKTLIILLICALALTSCGKTIMGNANGSLDDGSGSGYGVNGDGYSNSISGEDLALGSNGWNSDGNIPNPSEGTIFKDIHFGYDSSVIPDEAKSQIRQNADYLLKYSELKVEVEGHCDERGTNEYNFALGEARAKAVANLLTRYGVESSRISTISYGEELPLDESGTDAAFAKNRRVHFAIYKNKGQ